MFYLKHIAKVVTDVLSANLAFGRCVHLGIKQFLLNKENPAEVFEDNWYSETGKKQFRYSSDWTDKDMAETGIALLNQFVNYWESSGNEVVVDDKGEPLVEKYYSMILEHNGPNGAVQVQFGGILDVEVFTPEANFGLIDYKTPRAESTPLFASLADQHTAYQMLTESANGTHIDKCAYVELVKNKIPKRRQGKGPYIADVYWVPRRSDEMVQEYKLKILKTAQDISRGYFPRRPAMAFNSPCNLCDYPQACIGL
jgi:hypothetical protein